jgi:hypothetical protein
MSEAGEASVSITFEGLSMAQANQAVQELRSAILDRAEGVRMETRKEDPDTQDLGTTLVMFFGSGAAVAIAEGVRAYLTRRGSRIRITTAAGEIVASGDAASNIDVAATAAALAKLVR